LNSDATVQLWDPLLRLCHLSIAGVFFADYFFNEEGDDWHQWLGYYALACVVVRVVWGFVGPPSARWADFWPTPARLAGHARALLRGEPFHRLGHSPIGRPTCSAGWPMRCWRWCVCMCWRPSRRVCACARTCRCR